MKQIMTIEPCIITSNQIYDLYEVNKFREAVFKMIPKWVINHKHGNIVNAEYFLQFVGRSKGEEASSYYVFDIYSADPYLQNEIDEGGVEWVFKQCEEDWRTILKSIDTPTYKDFTKTWINDTVRLVFDLNYFTTYYEGIPEGDLEITFDKILEL